MTMSVYIPYRRYSGKLTLYYIDSEEEGLKDSVMGNRGFRNILTLLSVLCFIIFLLTGDIPLNQGVYQFTIIDGLQMLVKLFYRMIFFKILMTDTQLSWILFIEKYKNIYRNEFKTEGKKLRDIEEVLYLDTYYSY